MQQIEWHQHPFIKFQKTLHPLMLNERGYRVKTKIPTLNTGRGNYAAKVETEVIYNRDYVIAKLNYILKPILGLDASDIHDLVSEAIGLDENVET